jgi:hypothetical protein
MSIEFSFKKLEEIDNEIKLNEKRIDELRDAYYERESLQSKVTSLRRKRRRLHNHLENLHLYDGQQELQKIIKKFLRAEKKDQFLFSDEHTFVSIDKKGLEYHVSLKLTHFRHYDILSLIRKCEKISRMKVKDWFVTANNYTNGTSNIGFHFTLIPKSNNKTKGNKE